MTALTKALMGLYGMAWYAAAPALYLAPRIRKGFSQRMLRTGPAADHDGWVDIWIQAASGGEAMLAGELLSAMPDTTRASVLATTLTPEGLGVLDKTASRLHAEGSPLTMTTAYMPFDKPSLMDRALDRLQPKVVVLLETEIWPGLLWACARQGVPVVIANARMTSKSMAGYLALSGVLKTMAPLKMLAISDEAAARWSLVFGPARVKRMPNIKFDKFLTDMSQDGASPYLARIMGDAPLAVFGSVRREEEDLIVEAACELRRLRPQAVAAVFPKHMSRIAPLGAALDRAGLPWRLRSNLSGAPEPGTLVLWDKYGELAKAYALCRTAFVGGSLKPLGGQNFLEPLAQGVPPVIGPHWSNFDWVGREIVDRGLVLEVRTPQELAEAMAKALSRPRSREAIRKQAAAYAKKRSGGAKLACEALSRYL